MRGCGPEPRPRTARGCARLHTGPDVVPLWIVTTPRHTLTPGAPPALRLPRAPTLRSRAARGDAAAFAAVYERHHQALYRYCRSILRHDEDAQDALQSTMARAFAALQDERARLRAAPVAVPDRPQRGDLDPAPAARDDGARRQPRRPATLEDRVAEREELRLLQIDLADLPERQRAALVLRELNGLSHAEIGVVLELSPARGQAGDLRGAQRAVQCREGREMAATTIARMLSDGDGRVLRGRACARTCAPARTAARFRARPRRARAGLRALAPPLPAGAAAALLAAVCSAGAGAAPAARARLPPAAGSRPELRGPGQPPPALPWAARGRRPWAVRSPGWRPRRQSWRRSARPRSARRGSTGSASRPSPGRAGADRAIRARPARPGEPRRGADRAALGRACAGDRRTRRSRPGDSAGTLATGAAKRASHPPRRSAAAREGRRRAATARSRGSTHSAKTGTPRAPRAARARRAARACGAPGAACLAAARRPGPATSVDDAPVRRAAVRASPRAEARARTSRGAAAALRAAAGPPGPG